MNPVLVTGLFFIISTILSIYLIINNQHVRKIIVKHWKLLIILVLLNFVFKFPFNLKFFDGLEYEDSYIYKASARSIFEGDYKFSKINPYFPTSCISGSIKECNQPGIYVTNFLGYPYIIHLGYRIFGYHINIANVISLIFSAISIFFLFLVSFLIIDNLNFALICSFIYITIPIFNVYASTALTEPLSNAFLILVLLQFLIFTKSKQKGRNLLLFDILGLAAIASTLIFSILVKTTNLSLVFCLPIAGMIYSFFKCNKKEFNRYRILSTLPIMIIIFLFSLKILKFPIALEINEADIGVAPFSMSYLKTLAPVFLKSFISLKWYLFYSIFFVFGLYFGLKRKVGLFPIGIFFFYFFLYTSHYRSYYFTRGIPVFEDEALRYMISIISLYSIVVGIGLYYFLKGVKQQLSKRFIFFPYKIVLPALVFIIIVVSTIFTLRDREYFVEDEYISRIEPVKKTLEYMNEESDVLITSEHILFQIYGSSSLRLIDFCSIGDQIELEYIDYLIRSDRVLYLQVGVRDRITEQRYLHQYAFIDSKNRELLYSSDYFNLYRLTQ